MGVIFNRSKEEELPKHREELNVSFIYYARKCASLVDSDYEFSERMSDFIANTDMDLNDFIKHLPGQKELEEMYGRTLDINYNLPIYGRLGRLFPSTLLRNDAGSITKVQMVSIDSQEQGQYFLSLIRGNYEINTNGEQDGSNIRTPEFKANVVKDDKEGHYRLGLKNVNVTFRIVGNYKTLLFDKKLPEGIEPVDIIGNYETHNARPRLGLNQSFLDIGYTILHNRVSNDEYALHTYSLDARSSEVASMFNFFTASGNPIDFKSLVADVLFKEKLSSSVSEYVVDADCNMANIFRMYIQSLVNLYMPRLYSTIKYQNEIDRSNENLDKLVLSFCSYNINNPMNILNTIDFNTGSESVYVPPRGEDGLPIHSKDVLKGGGFEFFMNPIVVATTATTDIEAENERFDILMDISVETEILDIL